VGVLPPDPLYDYLDAIAASFRRRLLLVIDTPELLRTPKNRAQASRQRECLEVARGQIREQMRQKRRRAARGEVSVEIQISALDISAPPAASTSVKRYLDAMSGLVYRDDRQVAHLAVKRLAEDDPRWRDDPRERRGKPPSVMISVLPLRLYVADFDRAFRLHDSTRPDDEYGREGQELWANDWSMADDARLDWLRNDEREADACAGAYAEMGAELAAKLSRKFERQRTELESKLILHHRPRPEYRPGTRDQWKWDPEILEHLGPSFDPPIWMERHDMPGEFWLPLPPEVPGHASWTETISAEMSNHRARWPLLPDAFNTDLSLDIANLGAGANARDIDNLAHDVLRVFEKLYCRGRRGTVTGYRAYRSPSETPGVRVKVMTGARIQQLSDALEAARMYLISNGPRPR
jgi:Holliday junction resolvase RusA-like endonuclease